MTFAQMRLLGREMTQRHLYQHATSLPKNRRIDILSVQPTFRASDVLQLGLIVLTTIACTIPLFIG